MFQNLSDFFCARQEYIRLFDVWAEKFLPSARADHICYKCSSTSEFEHLRGLFEGASGFLYQSIIAERRIAIIKFLEPAPSVLGDILYLELSDQKPDGSQTSGFDHVEIYPTQGTIELLADNLAQKGFSLEKIIRPHHTTFDGVIGGTFKVRLEPETLMEKIKRDEMKT